MSGKPELAVRTVVVICGGSGIGLEMTRRAPEYEFEKDVENVRRAAKDLDVGFPVAIDNEANVWRAFDGPPLPRGGDEPLPAHPAACPHPRSPEFLATGVEAYAFTSS